MSTIQKPTITFLKNLSKNNDRPWFQDNKDKYDIANQNAKEFLSSVVEAFDKIDKIEKHKLFRIYRDVRFSKDKTPYNPSFRMSFTREKPYLRGGYYLMIGPKEGYIAAGFFNPAPKDLKLIRDNIALDSKPLRKIISAKKFKDTFGGFQGEQVKSSPKGFDKNHPDIDLIKFKQFYVNKSYPMKDMMDKNFIKTIMKDYKVIRPYFDYMSDILGHDLNGVPLY